MQDLKLYMMLLGSKPPGRHTEQHDIFFSIAGSLRECIPDILQFWPEAGKSIHIDAWRNVSFANGFAIKIVDKQVNKTIKTTHRLFFINLGGYKAGEFEEYHYKLVVAAPDRETAISKAKKSAFFRHNDSPHVDDKYGIDVDDVYMIDDILPGPVKERYAIEVLPSAGDQPEDEIRLGYFRLDRL